MARGETQEQIEERERALRLEKAHTQMLQQDRARLMQDDGFKRVMADIMEKGGMFKSVMTGNSQTYYLSGRQDFCREIWTELAVADSNAAMALLKPNMERSDV